MMVQDDLFAAIEQEERTRRRIADHMRSLRISWPEWNGPEVGMDASVNECIVFSLTKGREGYYYMAPIRLVGRDGDAFIAEINYGKEAPRHCREQNDERLRLEIWQVWAPWSELLRRRAELPGG